MCMNESYENSFNSNTKRKSLVDHFHVLNLAKKANELYSAPFICTSFSTFFYIIGNTHFIVSLKIKYTLQSDSLIYFIICIGWTVYLLVFFSIAINNWTSITKMVSITVLNLLLYKLNII